MIPLRTLGPQVSYAQAAHDVLSANLALIVVWSAFLEQPDRAHEQHQMRIAAKRLRYNLEVFADLLPASDPVVAAALDALRVLQQDLGILHDLDEMLFSIQDAQTRQQRKQYTKRREALRARAAERRTSFDVLLAQCQAERAEHHAHCVALWHDLIDRSVFAALRQTVEALDHTHALLAPSTPPAREPL